MSAASLKIAQTILEGLKLIIDYFNLVPMKHLNYLLKKMERPAKFI